LCYRILLELSIISKIKNLESQSYFNQAKNKSIIPLLEYVAKNRNTIIPNKYKTLHRLFTATDDKGSSMISKNSHIDLMNITSHGHWNPVKDDADKLLENTEELIQWIFT